MYSRNGSVPRLLRVTRSHGGYPRLKASARSRREPNLPHIVGNGGRRKRVDEVPLYKKRPLSESFFLYFK